MSIDQLLNAAYVRRFHTLREQQESQTIGEHSFGVALIICKLHPNPSVELVKAALYHDLAESELGDVPSPAKWRFKNFETAFLEAEAVINKEFGINVELTPAELLWLACADLLELYIYSEYRRKLVGADEMWKLINGRVFSWFLARWDQLPTEIVHELGEEGSRR